jgi:hypothetical protein
MYASNFLNLENKISINEVEKSIEEIINNIAIEAEVTILFDIKNSFSTTFNVFNATLQEVINLLCSRYHFHYYIKNKTIFIHDCLIAKTYKVNNLLSSLFRG